MRLLLPFLFLVASACAAVPPELAAALKNFRGDPPKGWSFTQTTLAEGKSIVERCDAARPEFDRWKLLQKDGRPPTVEELRDYGEGRSRRSRTGTAPGIADQLDLTTLETVRQTNDLAVYRCRLRPGESRDKTAPHLSALLTLHRPTRTLETIELSNTAPFSPTLGVKIVELKTRMTYSHPEGETPSLPQKVETHVRGTAFFFKTLDADMTVTFSDYVRVTRR